MRNHSEITVVVLSLVGAIFFATVTPAHAASGTWNGASASPAGPTQYGQLWSNTAKWVGNLVAGTTGTTTGTDTLTFTLANHYTIELDGNYNLKYIINSPDVHAHAITTQTGNFLSLTGGGSITGTGAGATNYYVPIRLEGGSGESYSFLGDRIGIYGPVSGTAAAGGNYDLILGGSGSLSKVGTDTTRTPADIGVLADGSYGGTLSVIKAGTGMWELSNSNSYTGATLVRSGTLKFNQANSFGTGTSAITLGDSGTATADNIELRFGGNITLSRNVVVNNYNPTGTTTISVRDNLGGPVLSGSLTLNRDVQFMNTGSGVLNVTGVITGSGGFTKLGPDRLVLSGTNTFGGDVVVNGGVLRATHGVGLPATAALSLNGGVWESGATITRNLGSADGEVQLANYSGFSANGSSAINVNLSGGTALVWGMTTGFNPTTLVPTRPRPTSN